MNSKQMDYKEKKFKRFEDVDVPMDADISQWIRPQKRGGKQYGWYVYIQRGARLTLEAFTFQWKLQEVMQRSLSKNFKNDV